MVFRFQVRTVYDFGANPLWITGRDRGIPLLTDGFPGTRVTSDHVAPGALENKSGFIRTPLPLLLADDIKKRTHS